MDRHAVRYAYLALAALLITGSLAYLFTASTPTDPPRDDISAQATANTVRRARLDPPSDDAPTHLERRPVIAKRAPSTPTPVTAPPETPTPSNEDEQGDTSIDLSQVLPPGSAPTMAEVIEELHKAGIYTGIGAFNPPGTSPPLIGLQVPDDFELPEGYVRHYQATDDGQRIAPILMFSPDYEFFDDNGDPIEIPADRVVTPDLAPPGMPLSDVEIPGERPSEESAD